MSSTLHDFIIANREQIIARARRRVRERTRASERTDARVPESKLENGIPLFLSQLTDALASPSTPTRTLRAVGAVGAEDASRTIRNSAALHGRELLRGGFTVGQVVHGYGDVCQVVTQMATEEHAPISTEDFREFNGRLDDAIAGAVTEYGRQRERDLAYEGTERLGIFAHELRNLLNTAVLSFEAIKNGVVGIGGSTSAIHARSLSGLTALVERSLAEVRLEAGVPQLARFSLAEFMEEVAIGAAMQAEGSGIRLTVGPVDADAAIDADWQLLASAVTNLVQNAFKFTRPHGAVLLTTRVTADRVLIDVCDECGGLPPGKAEDPFGPFTRGSGDSSGLGLGLSIARSAVRANEGELHVRDIPGKGCVFTVDLPRKPSASVAPPPVRTA